MSLGWVWFLLDLCTLFFLVILLQFCTLNSVSMHRRLASAVMPGVSVSKLQP